MDTKKIKKKYFLKFRLGKTKETIIFAAVL